MKRARLPMPSIHRPVAQERRQLCVELEFIRHRLKRMDMVATWELVDEAVAVATWEVANLENGGIGPPKKRGRPVFHQAMKLLLEED